MRKWILKGITWKHHFTLHFSNETQSTLHFFQGRVSTMPEIRADLFLAGSKTGMYFFLNFIILNRFTILVPS